MEEEIDHKAKGVEEWKGANFQIIVSAYFISDREFEGVKTRKELHELLYQLKRRGNSDDLLVNVLEVGGPQYMIRIRDYKRDMALKRFIVTYETGT